MQQLACLLGWFKGSFDYYSQIVYVCWKPWPNRWCELSKIFLTVVTNKHHKLQNQSSTSTRHIPKLKVQKVAFIWYCRFVMTSLQMFCFILEETIFKELNFDTFDSVFYLNVWFNSPSGINNPHFSAFFSSSHVLPILWCRLLSEVFIVLRSTQHINSQCSGQRLKSKWAKVPWQSACVIPGYTTVSSMCRIDSTFKGIQWWTMHLSHPFPLGYTGLWAKAVLKGISVKRVQWLQAGSQM